MAIGCHVYSLAVLLVMCLLVACSDPKVTVRQDAHQRCFIHKFCLSVCLLPWHSSLSVHNFQGAFSRVTKLARPLAKVVSCCLLGEAHQTESYRHFYNKKTVWLLLEIFLYAYGISIKAFGAQVEQKIRMLDRLLFSLV